MLSLTDIQTLLAETKQSLEEAQKTFLEQSKLLEQKSAELQATLNMNAILELRLTTENQLRSEAASRALDSAAEVEQLSARVAKLEAALRNANRWIARTSWDAGIGVDCYGQERHVPRIWDLACAECIPDGPMVVAGFRCAVHAARASLEVKP